MSDVLVKNGSFLLVWHPDEGFTMLYPEGYDLGEGTLPLEGLALMGVASRLEEPAFAQEMVLAGVTHGREMDEEDGVFRHDD